MSENHATHPASLVDDVLDPKLKPFTAAAGIGLAVSIIGCFVNAEHFFHSYLVAYSAVLTIVLGMLFIVMLHYVVDAGWSTVVRRPAEQFLAGMIPLAVLSLPIFIGMSYLYDWISSDSDLAQHKAPYLNVPFFLIRAAIFIAAWIALAWYFRGQSLKQDETADPSITLRLRKWSAPGLIVYALTFTFAFVDWIMTLDYEWFSTIFGVYVWSGAVVSAFALLSIIAIVLRRGPLEGKLPLDRVHDLGKWTSAFAVFWAYIAFSQYFLIWYANIPEETAWLIHRWTGTDGEATWWLVSIAVPTLLFAVPFVVLLSANTKRNMKVMTAVCAVILVGHYVDCYWLVMPSAHEHGPAWSLVWIDAATLALVGGVAGFFIVRAMNNAALHPVHDPRLAEAIAEYAHHGKHEEHDSPREDEPDRTQAMGMNHGG